VGRAIDGEAWSASSLNPRIHSFSPKACASSTSPKEMLGGVAAFVKPWGAKEVATMEKAIVCLRCIGDRRLYKATSTQPPALGEQCSRCGEKATLDLEVRRVVAK